MSNDSHIRRRMVCLAREGSSTQAADACAALRGVKGIVAAEPVGRHRLKLVYSLENLSFELVEALLRELGFKLDGHLFAVIRRNIYQYLEDNAREKMQIDEQRHELICDIDAELPHDEPEKYWHKYK